MSTATAAPITHRAPTGSATDEHLAVRRLLVGCAVTLVPLLGGLAALQLGWELTAGSTWGAAAAAVTGYTSAVAGWLRLRGWATRTVVAVICTVPAVLALPLAVGWLSPSGLVLWGPVTTVLTVAQTTGGRRPAAPA